jgi:hypothetical protein
VDGWPADLLCSRNARPEKALVGRAQWEINRPPVLGKESLRSFGGEEGGGWSSRGLCSLDVRSELRPDYTPREVVIES